MATCSSCKNLDTKKKVNGACSGVKYNCKKIKKYVAGDMDSCDKYASCYRSVDDCNKIYREGRDWDDDKHSAGFYFFLGLILLIITIIMFLFNKDLY